MFLTNRKLAFYATLLTFFLCLCSCLACHHGNSGSLADPEAVLGLSDSPTPEDPNNPDDGTDPDADDESSECPTAICAP